MNGKPAVIVSEALPSGWLDTLTPQLEVWIGLDQPPERLAQVVGLLSMLTVRVDQALLDRLPALRVVSTMAVGYDNIDLRACAARNIAVGHTPGVLTDATADLTMALILALLRNLVTAQRDAASGAWQTWSPTGWLGRSLRGLKLGVVGLGQIGQAVARRASAFGMHVAYTSPRRNPALERELALEAFTLHELVATCDVISLHAPLRDTTHHLIDADVLARMRQGSYLINTARGPLIDQDAVVAALDRGQLAGVGLDVTTPEPLPPTHPFFSRPNVVVLPHIGSATVETRRAMAMLAAQNLLRGLAKQPLVHPVALPERIQP